MTRGLPPRGVAGVVRRYRRAGHRCPPIERSRVAGEGPGGNARAAFGHRRLSILDLSPGGPRPPWARGTAGSGSPTTARSSTTSSLRDEPGSAGAATPSRPPRTRRSCSPAYAEWGEDALPPAQRHVRPSRSTTRRTGRCSAVRESVRGQALLLLGGRGDCFAFRLRDQGAPRPSARSLPPGRRRRWRAFLVAGALAESDATFFHGRCGSLPGGHCIRIREDGTAVVRRWYTPAGAGAGRPAEAAEFPRPARGRGGPSASGERDVSVGHVP